MVHGRVSEERVPNVQMDFGTAGTSRVGHTGFPCRFFRLLRVLAPMPAAAQGAIKKNPKRKTLTVQQRVDLRYF